MGTGTWSKYFRGNPNIITAFPEDPEYSGSMAENIQNSDVKLIFVSYIPGTDPKPAGDGPGQDLPCDPVKFIHKTRYQGTGKLIC
jgi:hypothetical protein